MSNLNEKIDEDLKEKILKEEKDIPIIIMLSELNDANIQKLEELGVKNLDKLELIEGVSGIADSNLISKISKLDFVKEIHLDREKKPL